MKLIEQGSCAGSLRDEMQCGCKEIYRKPNSFFSSKNLNASLYFVNSSRLVMRAALKSSVSMN